MTIKKAKALCNAQNCAFRKDRVTGEFVVTLRGSNAQYYTNDIDDAIGTAAAMNAGDLSKRNREAA